MLINQSTFQVPCSAKDLDSNPGTAAIFLSTEQGVILPNDNRLGE